MTMQGPHAVITEEMLARARSRIGQVWTPTEPYFNTAATKDTILHFANGIGDKNPLFRNQEYARRTKYGRLVAPPCFLYSVYWPSGLGGGFPGIHAWHSGNDWEWYRPILEGDEFTFANVLTDVVEKTGRSAGRIVITYSDTYYWNQRGELVAKARGWAVWAERGAAGERGKYRHIPKATYSQEELERIYADYDREVIRGGEPRYWEDVEEGEELTPVVKGPLSLRDIYAWLMGAGSPFMRAHGLFVDYLKRHPASVMVDRSTGEVDVPELVHMQDSRAQEIGIGGAYDYGSQRVSWLGHLLTNWIGDEGFLWKLHAELRLFNMVGDTTWCKGRVVRKYVEADRPCVEIECWGENQRGEVTMPGRAVVILPSRTYGPVRYPEPPPLPEAVQAVAPGRKG